MVPKHASDTTLPERNEWLLSTPVSSIAIVCPRPVNPDVCAATPPIYGTLSTSVGLLSLSLCIDFTKGEELRCSSASPSTDIAIAGMCLNLWCDGTLKEDKDCSSPSCVLVMPACCSVLFCMDLSNPSGMKSVSSLTIILTLPSVSAVARRSLKLVDVNVPSARSVFPIKLATISNCCSDSCGTIHRI